MERVARCVYKNGGRRGEDLGCGMWNVECGIWNVECGMWDVED